MTGSVRCSLQPCIQQQRPGPAARRCHHGDREDGGHQEEVQTRPCVWRQDCVLRLPRPVYRPAVPGELASPSPVSAPHHLSAPPTGENL